MLQQQSKYFTPEIEDIRVGYECEIQDYKGRWECTKAKDDMWGDFAGLIDKNQIRVPYLTKEQIEAEGWKVTYREFKLPPYEVDWIVARKGKYELWINLAMHKSMHLGVNEYKQSRLFRGQCKDINTFRQIMKLLNI